MLQDHLNQNQGAESSLAFYLSARELTQAEGAELSIPPHAQRNRPPERAHLSPEQRAVLISSIHPREPARIVNIIGRRWR